MKLSLPICCPPLPEASLEPAEAERLASILRAIADPVRLRLVSMLSQIDERCACDFVDPLGVSQPTVSHHLKVLTEAGIIDRRKQGRWMFYRLNRSVLSSLASALEPGPALTKV